RSRSPSRCELAALGRLCMLSSRWRRAAEPDHQHAGVLGETPPVERRGPLGRPGGLERPRAIDDELGGGAGGQSDAVGCQLATTHALVDQPPDELLVASTRFGGDVAADAVVLVEQLTGMRRAIDDVVELAELRLEDALDALEERAVEPGGGLRRR